MKYESSEQKELTTSLGEDGLGKQSWWVEQWMELINSYRYKKRLERAWSYAREGNVLIDDRQKNIDAWVAAGGIGIVHTSAADTIEQLKTLRNGEG